MRKLVWFAIGFGAVCGISSCFSVSGFLHLSLLIPVMIGLWFREHPVIRRIGLLFLGFCVGLYWFAQFQRSYLNPVYELDGIIRQTDIRCSAFGEETDYGIRVKGSTTIQDKTYPVMVYLDDGIAPEPGMMLSGSFRFRVTAPGGQKESTYLQGEGIFLLAYQNGEMILSKTERMVWDVPAMLRQRFLELLRQGLPEDAFSFAKALMLGDSSGLDYATLTDLTVSGVRHIVAVSGLHVSILFSLLGFVTFRKRFLSALFGIPALLLFAAMTGFTPSVCRACLMSGLMLLASLVNRQYDGPTALAFAGLVLLMVNPLVITSVSYQLSFASVAGIYSCSPGIRRWLQSVWKSPKGRTISSKVINGAILSISITLGATVTTVPLCAVYFGTVSLAAVLTNLMVLWVVSVIFYGLIILCLLQFVWPAAAMLLGKTITMLIRYVLWISEIVADFPLASIYMKSPYIMGWLIFVYLLLAVFLLSGNRKSFEFACCVTVGLCCALLASWSEPNRGEVRFIVLDVGQGQCLLMQSDGRTYMVDCGGSTDAIAADSAAETLLSQGISKLDCVILTHYDKDHAGGLENLLSRIDTELLILPPVYSELQLKADHILHASEDLTIASDNDIISIYSSANNTTSNENSLCILFDTENCDILITGDRSGFGEQLLLRRAELPDVDVLVAGHHGSGDSTCKELLEAVRPEVVCISAGEGNRFGHPSAELLQRLDAFGCTVYRTDLNRDIIIRR